MKFRLELPSTVLALCACVTSDARVGEIASSSLGNAPKTMLVEAEAFESLGGCREDAEEWSACDWGWPATKADGRCSGS